MRIIKDNNINLGGAKCRLAPCCMKYIDERLRGADGFSRAVENEIDLMFRVALLTAQEKIKHWPYVLLKYRRTRGVAEMIAFEDREVQYNCPRASICTG